MTGVLKYSEKKCVGKTRWLQISVRKMYSTFERVDGCEYSIEAIIKALKERRAGTNIFGIRKNYSRN